MRDLKAQVVDRNYGCDVDKQRERENMVMFMFMCVWKIKE